MCDAANTTNGFSIVKVADPQSNEARVHGLGVAPDFFICKSTASADSWHTYWKVMGRTKYINLNGTGPASSSDQFGSQEPDSTYFYVKSNTGSGANKAGGMVYYLWNAVEQYSSFGEYLGNGNADGPFVFLGFKPALLIIKGHDYASNWFIHDNKRPGYNVNTGPLRIAAEAELTVTTYDLDILSNGFKMRTSGGDSNQDGKNYVYMAWASNPFQANGGLAR